MTEDRADTGKVSAVTLGRNTDELQPFVVKIVPSALARNIFYYTEEI